MSLEINTGASKYDNIDLFFPSNDLIEYIT